MNKIIILFSFILLFTFCGLLKADSLYVYPSLYYTLGKYSGGESSIAYSGYVTLAFNLKSFLTIGYEKLNLDYKTGNYPQNNLVFSFLQNFYPSYLKATYGFINGRSEPSGSQSLPKDKINVFGLEYYFFKKMFYYGIAGTYVSENNGYTNLSSLQLKLKIEYILSPSIFISLKPAFTYVSDNRNLFSASINATWNPFSTLYFKVGGVIGKRALYFDTELLTMFNQNETQSLLYSAQLDYVLFNSIRISSGILHTQFSSFNIDYYFGGIRTAIKF